MFKEIPLSQIKPGRFQPRQSFDQEKLLDLATSIEEEGLLYPLLVVLDQDNRYELIGGERRWRASCALALAKSPAFNDVQETIKLTANGEFIAAVRDGFHTYLSEYTILVNEQEPDLSEEQQRVRTVADNLQRADLTPFEEAQAVLALKKELSLSIRKLAQKIGKSKGWVEDRLNLMKLDPAAAEAISQATDDDKVADLDMTTIREVARKLPKQLQGPVIEVLQHYAAKYTTDELKNMVSQLARMADPANWVIAVDPDNPAPPIFYNRSRLIIHLLNSLTPEQTVERLLKLHGKDSYSNYLGKLPKNILSNSWDSSRVARALHGITTSDDVWDLIAPDQGWTCANCLKGPLLSTIQERNPEFDNWEAPCLRLYRKPDGIETCEDFVLTGDSPDPRVITVPGSIVRALPTDAPEIAEIKQMDRGDYYVLTPEQYQRIYSAANGYQNQAVEQAAEAAKTSHLIPLQQYWDAQANEQVDLFDFQAHACHKCVNYELGNKDELGSPCRFASNPIRRGDELYSPDFGVLVDKQGRAVPRCSKFRYKETPRIICDPELDTVHTSGEAARKMFLEWYQRLTAEAASNKAGQQIKLLFGVLGWLPGGPPKEKDLLEMWSEMGDGLMLHLLNVGIYEAQAISRYTYDRKPAYLITPVAGQGTEWKAMPWDSYQDQRAPYSWDDWPVPWEDK